MDIDWPWLEPAVPTSFEPCWADGKGVAVTVKLPLPLAVPPVVVIETLPAPVPGITIATKALPVFDITIALLPPMVSAVGLPKFVPFMVISVPTEPVAGLKEVIAGAAANNLPGKIITSSIIAKNDMVRIIVCFDCLAGRAAGNLGHFFIVLYFK